MVEGGKVFCFIDMAASKNLFHLFLGRRKATFWNQLIISCLKIVQSFVTSEVEINKLSFMEYWGYNRIF